MILIRILLTAALFIGHNLEAAEVNYPRNLVVESDALYLSGAGIGRYELSGRQANWRVLEQEQTHELVVAEERLFVGGSGGVRALNKRSGELLWSVTDIGAVFSPVLAGKQLLVATQNGVLRSIDADSGKLLWKRKLGRGWIYPPVVYGERIITGGQDAMVWALGLATGNLIWHKTLQQELVYRPVAAEDSVLFTTFAGDVIALNVVDGNEHWRREFDSPGILSTVNKKSVLLSGMDGVISLLNAEQGSLIWQVTLPSKALVQAAEKAGALLVMTEEGSYHVMELSTGLPRVQGRVQGAPLGGTFLSSSEAILFYLDRNISRPMPVSINVDKQ